MNIKEEFSKLVLEIKELGINSGILKESKFADWKLQDGTTIVRTDTDTLDKGSKITVISDSGEVPLVDGDYTVVIDDAAVAIKVVNGYVTEISGGNAPEEPVMPGMPAEPVEPSETMANVSPTGGESNPHNVNVPALFEQVQDHGMRLQKCEEMVAKCTPKSSMEEMASKFAAVEAENKNMKDIIAKMFELVQKIGETPSAQPVTKKTSMKAVEKQEFAAPINDLDEKIKRLNKLNNF